MPEPFDPFVEWLGFQRGQAPASHYDLLDVDPGEHDSWRIANAADLLAARVRRIRPGPHMAEWQQLLDAIREAKACLTDEETRAAYDASLAGPDGEIESGGPGSAREVPDRLESRLQPAKAGAPSPFGTDSERLAHYPLPLTPDPSPARGEGSSDVSARTPGPPAARGEGIADVSLLAPDPDSHIGPKQVATAPSSARSSPPATRPSPKPLEEEGVPPVVVLLPRRNWWLRAGMLLALIVVGFVGFDIYHGGRARSYLQRLSGAVRQSWAAPAAPKVEIPGQPTAPPIEEPKAEEQTQEAVTSERATGDKMEAPTAEEPKGPAK